MEKSYKFFKIYENPEGDLSRTGKAVKVVGGTRVQIGGKK